VEKEARSRELQQASSRWTIREDDFLLLQHDLGTANIELNICTENEKAQGLYAAVMTQSLEEVKKFIHGSIEEGEFVNYKAKGGSNEGRTPVFEAVTMGNAAMVALLVEFKADVTTKDDNGWCPVLNAASLNKNDTIISEILQDLFDGGAMVGDSNGDIWSTDKVTKNRTHWGVFSPLNFAAAKGDVGVTKILIKQRAEVNSLSVHGDTCYTPLQAAEMHNNKMVAELLKEKNGIAKTSTKDGQDKCIDL